MLTTPVDPSETEPNGKENYFENPNAIHDNNAKPKTEKRKKMKGKMQPEQEAIPTEDFDRLLVRLHTPLVTSPAVSSSSADATQALPT